MAAALGPPEVIAQLENAAKVLMVSAPRPAPAPAPPGPTAPAQEPLRGGGGAAPGSPSCRPTLTPSWGCARPRRAWRERGSRPRRPPGTPDPVQLQSRAGRAPLWLGAGGHGRPANHPLRCEPSGPRAPSPAATSGEPQRQHVEGRLWDQGHRARLRPVRPMGRAFPSFRPDGRFHPGSRGLRRVEGEKGPEVRVNVLARPCVRAGSVLRLRR